MEHYVGLDVSLKLTAICIVDQTGKIEREGMVVSNPEAIAAFIKSHAPHVARVGLETGATATWLWTELNKMGLPIICIDARHAKAALKMQINKSDRNDAVGIARIMQCGWYKEVRVKDLRGRACMVTTARWITAAVALVAFASSAVAQSDLNPKNRQELKRADVAGTNLEVIISVVEAQPGELLARHIHHGEEAFYVLQGATVETPDGKEIKLPAGAADINHRDVPHAGAKVVGDTALKYVAVHVVDKGAPLYDAPPK